MSTAEQQRRWRARHGAKTGQIGRPAVQPCGTVAAAKRHRRRDEALCGPCRLALAEYQREMYRRRNAKKVPSPAPGEGGPVRAPVG